MPDLSVFDSVNIVDAFDRITFDTIIDDSVFNATTQGNNSPNIVFVNSQVGYVFYVDANADLVYRKSTDGGLQWGSPVVVFTDATIGVFGYAVWYDRWTVNDNGTEIHIAWMTDDDDIRYRSLETNGDTLGSETFVVQSLGQIGSGSLYPSITVSTIGNIFVSGGSSGPTGNRDVYKSENGGTSFVGTSQIFISGVSDEIVLMPLDTVDGDIMAIHLNSNVKDLDFVIYDETLNTWNAASAIDANFNNASGRHRFTWGAAFDETTGNIYVVGSNDGNAAGNDIKAYRYTGSWATLTDPFTGIGTENSQSKPFIDRCGNIFAFYTKGGAGSKKAFFKVSADKGITWSAELQVGASEDDIIIIKTSMQGDNFYAVGFNDDLDSLLGVKIAISDLCVNESDAVEIITIVENVTAELTVAGIPLLVFDAITVVENTQVSLDVLNISVFEFSGLLITESIDVIDLVVEVGVVAEITLIVENVDLLLDELFLSVFDSVTIAEFDQVTVITFTPPVDVSDTVAVVENVSVSFDIIELGIVNDLAAIIENVSIVVDVQNLSVFDNATVVEDANAILDILNLELFDIITVSESVSVLDIVVEVGIVQETLLIIEIVNVNIPIDISVFDIVTVVEDFQSLQTIPLLIFDTVVVTEDVTVFDIVVEVFAFDTVTIAEAVTVFDIVIELFAIDSASVLDNIGIFKGGIEVGDEVGVSGALVDFVNVTDFADVEVLTKIFVFESLTVTEFINIFDKIIELGPIFETITIGEFAEVFDIGVGVGPVFETITINEFVDAIAGQFITFEDSVLIIDDVLLRFSDVTDLELIDATRIFEVVPRNRFFISKQTGFVISR